MNRIAQSTTVSTPTSVSAQIGPREPGDLYTFADAVAHCPTHRAQHEEAEARYAEFLTENGASVQRRDRRQLDLPFSRHTRQANV